MARKLRVLGILTILIIFPLMSWYYLKTGYNYQMDSRAELKDYGKLPNFAWSTAYSDYSIDSLEKKMAVLSFIGEDKKNTDIILEVIQKLNIQFGDNSNLKILTFPLLAQRTGISNFVNIQNEKKINPFQHKIVQAPEEDLKNWLGSQIKYPIEWRPKEEDAPDVILEKRSAKELNEYPFFVLVDNKNTIRNFYHIDSVDEVKRMVEHIALLLPRDVRPGIEFEREKEK